MVPRRKHLLHVSSMQVSHAQRIVSRSVAELLRNRLSQEALFPAESGMDVTMRDETNTARQLIVRGILIWPH